MPPARTRTATRKPGIGRTLTALTAAALMTSGAQAQWGEFGGIAGQIGDLAGRPTPGGLGGGRGFYLTPSLTLSETLTDNANLSSTDPQWDAITQATAGISMGGGGARWTGNLNYALTGSVYARGTGENGFTHNLSASGTVEAIENRVFVDGFATVSQQLISPFGQRPADPTLPSNNTATVFNYGISPYAQGTIGGAVDYYARLNLTGSTNSESSVYGFQDYSAFGRLQGGTMFRRLSWALTAAGRSSAYGNDLRTGNYGATASLIYAVTPYFNLRGNAGVEFQNYLDANQKQRSELYGAGFDWQPTDRTSISAFYENRFFGDSYLVSLQHRTPRTVWSYQGRQGISQINGVSSVSLGTNYDLFYQQFASIEPDPVKRDQLVREFLRLNGIPASQQIVGNFLTTSIQLERSHNLSFSYLINRRSTMTLSAFQNDRSALVDFLGAGNGFDNASFVRDRGFSASLSHQLTPRQSVSIYGSHTNTEGVAGGPSTSQDQIYASWNTSLNSRMNVSVLGRHTRFDSPTNPYDETALIATLYIGF